MKKILGYLLIVLYVFFADSTSLFIHTHHYAGKIITHSHPYLPNGNRGVPNHSHSESQCLWIQIISSELYLAQPAITSLVAIFVLLSSLHILTPKHIITRIHSWLSPRAPPQVLFK